MTSESPSTVLLIKLKNEPEFDGFWRAALNESDMVDAMPFITGMKQYYGPIASLHLVRAWREKWEQ